MNQTREQTNYLVERGRPRSRELWFGMMSGPVIWTVQFLLVYLLVEFSCFAGILQTGVLGMQVITLVVLVLTLAALAAIVYGGYFSYRKYMQLGGRHLIRRENLSNSPARFMALSGLALNLLFGLLILLMGIPAIFLAPCVR